jgi:hypothetical protein
MIISHTNKFIFIKSEKTAGSSVELAISKSLKKNDIWIEGSHMTPHEILEQYDNTMFNKYFKFSIVRNPFDKMVSHYFWQQHIEPNRFNSFEEFMNFMYQNKAISSWRFFSINGQFILNGIATFENLQNDLKNCTIDIPIDISNIFEKSNIRPANIEYQEMYTRVTKKMVEDQCANEIAMFDYKF